MRTEFHLWVILADAAKQKEEAPARPDSGPDPTPEKSHWAGE